MIDFLYKVLLGKQKYPVVFLLLKNGEYIYLAEIITTKS